MTTRRVMVAVAAAVIGFASQARAADPCAGGCSLGSEPKPFVGLRGGLGLPSNAFGIAPQIGLEAGVAVRNGTGIGVRLITSTNPPRVDGIGDAAYAFGFAADLRYYFEVSPTVQLYPALAIGFLTGPDEFTRKNLVLPLVNPGFGGRMSLGGIYFAFEFGMALPAIPNFSFALGWEGAGSSPAKGKAEVISEG